MGNDVFKLKHSVSGADILTIPGFDSEGCVKTFFTTRTGGVSPTPYESLNFGGRNDDDRNNVIENRRRVFESLGHHFSVLVFPQQVHGDAIACLRAEDIGDSDNITFSETDAVITREKDVLLTSLHADCIPVYLFDPKNMVIGMVHAGWRGTKLSIAAKTAIRMKDELGAETQHIKAIVGPGISMCCFEVESYTYEEFKTEFPDIDDYAERHENGKYNIDLKRLNEMQLRRAGVNDIAVSDLCTVCEADMFFSYRREKGITGRMGAGIGLI